MTPVILLIVCSLVSFNKMYGDAIVVTHFCKEVTSDSTKVQLIVNILVENGDAFVKAYAFDAAMNDVTTSSNRETDPNCIKDDTGSSTTVPITYDITVTTTDASHDCGIEVKTVGGVTTVTFLFHIYTFRDDVIAQDDLTLVAVCKMNDLSGTEVRTPQFESSGRRQTVLQTQLDGGFLTILDKNNRPVDMANIGEKVRLSAEYYPNLQQGPDNFGNEFYVGFLGIDPVTGESTSELYVILYPRYNLPTSVAITTKHGYTKYNLLDGDARKVVLESDLMGCSDGGVAEIDIKAVRIQTLSQVREIGVLVCSKETGTGDCYEALPTDVTGTEYVAVSMSVADESSEIMIIAQENDTEVTVDIPDSYAHVITLEENESAAGGSITFILDEGEAFHLAQSSATAIMSNVNGYHIISNTSISVISGNRNYANNHAVVQLPPTPKCGKEYVLMYVDISGDSRLTTYIIQPVQSGDTVVTRYLSSSSSETYTIAYGEFLNLDIDAACELMSDKPVSVTQVVNGPVDPGAVGSSMTWVPPVNRWSPVYSITHPEYAFYGLAVFKTLDDHGGLTVTYDDTTSFPYSQTSTINVAGPSRYVTGGVMPFVTPGKYSFNLGGSGTFYMTGFLKDDNVENSGAAVNLFGIKLSDADECVTVGRRGDLLDNDCDGEVDEEVLDFADNDGDGLVDEDVMASIEEYSGGVAMRVTNCMLSPDTTFSNSAKTIALTDVDGCAVQGQLVKVDGEFEPSDLPNTGSGIQPKVLRSGWFNVVLFLDQPILYYKCDITKYCISASDTDCIGICDSGKRKRRQVNSNKPLDNITTSTWVFPYTVPSNPTLKESVQDASSFKSCLDNTYVQVSYILLLLLMLVSFFTALCFCYLFKRNNRRDKEMDKNFYKHRSKRSF